MTIVAIVRTGEKFSFDYVERMRNMVARHMHRDYELVCLTDQPERCDDVGFVDIGALNLPGWWAKMALFAPEWRGRHRVVYLDLDTVIIRDVSELVDVPGEFSTCENFTRLAGNHAYPCRYNSSVMVIGGGMASYIWTTFDRERVAYMTESDPYGDQRAIELIVPDAPFLQSLVRPNFFLNYRNLTAHKPAHAAVINFGGRNKPHACDIGWVQEEWR
jgi:hypothetical protein